MCKELQCTFIIKLWACTHTEKMSKGKMNVDKLIVKGLKTYDRIDTVRLYIHIRKGKKS